MRLARIILGMALAASLTACVGPDGVIRMPGLVVPQASADASSKPPTPPVCSEIEVVRYSAGKPGVTVADVQAALALPVEANPLGHARNLLGDTIVTITQIQDNNSVLDRLCSPPPKP